VKLPRRSAHQEQVNAQMNQIGTLAEPVRRALYRYVAAQPEPVSREQAAAGVQVAHHVAKFHLDKLEHAGLLEVEYRRPPGRTGPGAGRPTKLYRRSPRDVAVSLPERQYNLAGQVMAQAITDSADQAIPMQAALRAAASRAGKRLAEQTAWPSTDPSDPSIAVDTLCTVLAENGYEPQLGGDHITLGNCPFHELAEEHTELICGLNVDLVNGLLDTIDNQFKAHLNPAPGRCCVTIGLSESGERP
jgi:predicted ArsR family transcriptional regulator